MPAGPGYPFIPGGAPAVFKNTVCARMCKSAEDRRARAQREGWWRGHRCVLRGFARVARCVHAMAPALRARAWPRLRMRAGRRKRVCVQLRVACVPCDLCKLCGWEQCWQHCVPYGVRRACALGEAQSVGIIPCARAQECGRRGLRRPGQRAGAQRACLWCHPWFWGENFFNIESYNINAGG